MPRTWQAWSNIVLGYVADQTPSNERYVVSKIIEAWVHEGLSNERILLRYNAGGASQCSSGYNSFGVWYNSCAYVQEGLRHLSMM